jgi:hypothetical protein
MTNSPESSVSSTLAEDFNTFQWVDTLGWKDDEEVLIFTTNRLQRFFNPQIYALDFQNESDFNFRVFEIETPGHTSYLTSTSQQPPLYIGPSPGRVVGEGGGVDSGTVAWIVCLVSFCVVLIGACVAYTFNMTKKRRPSESSSGINKAVSSA